MALERNVYNPYIEQYPYHCTLAALPMEGWFWISEHVASGHWFYELVYDPTNSLASEVWLGFERQEDYIKFCLTWV